MRFIFDSKIFIKSSFKDENELEKVVQSNYESIFGEDVIFIPQKSIETEDGFGTIPEAIVINFSAKKWYIVEVELARHDIWGHIVRQISMQIVAADNPKMRHELIRIGLREIEKSMEWKKKLGEKGIAEIRIQRFLEEIMENAPIIILPIDDIPKDIIDWGKTLKRDFVPIMIEKYVAGDDIAYRIASDRFFALPEEKDQPIKGGMITTEEQFLKQCEMPGQTLYRQLKKLAEEKGHKFEPRTKGFSYYVIHRNGEKFCPLTLWPTGVTILKWNLTEKNGVTPEALSAFREGVLKINALANKYDTMTEPGLGTQEGDISEYEISSFISAFKKLIEDIK